MPYSLKDIPEPGHCLQCGELIVYGRQDRKFCCTACKNKYHNQRIYPVRGRTARHVLRVLDNNRGILVKLMRMGIRSMDRMTLSHLGFDDHFMTSCQKRKGHLVYTCLDVVYEMTPSRIKKLAFLGEGADTSESRASTLSLFSEDP